MIPQLSQQTPEMSAPKKSLKTMKEAPGLSMHKKADKPKKQVLDADELLRIAGIPQSQIDKENAEIAEKQRNER